ncbi:sulfatase-like hydrolase/transferase [uncultured Polaribacter sp.]|uniref:sulfatase family protein n=1 Tax=uncultured Polaribacter sp. TaxID=174711 RepID=UPI002608115E|nr:sulfatase-like hydrolase/transferase [uncultured Polaribacter sp.]
MNRFFMLLAIVCLISCNSSDRKKEQDISTGQKTNVLVIMTDQLNPQVLSCYGGYINTPHIDKLANEGAMFTAGYCSTPFCSPSRASFVTGKYTHNHGIPHNCNFDQYGEGKPEMAAIEPTDTTFDVILNKAGYSTHHYGKWHLANVPMDSVPNRSYYPYPDMYNIDVQYTEDMKELFAKVQQQPKESYMFWQGWSLPVEQTEEFKKAVKPIVESGKGEWAEEYFGKMGRLLMSEENTFEYKTANKAIERLKACTDAGRPFSITASFNVPHDPNVAPDPYYSNVNMDEIKFAPNSSREKFFDNDWAAISVDLMGDVGLKEFMRIYIANVLLIDAQVGRLMKVLEESGQRDNTIVLFTADHGDMSSAHRMVWKSTKAFYDEVATIPYIISYPKAVKKNRVYKFPVNIADFMPTILAFTKQKIPDDLDGVNLAPFITGKKSLSEAPKYTICERLSTAPNLGYITKETAKGQYMIRGMRYKYSVYLNGNEYLYDMQNDPGEETNLAYNINYAGVLERMKKELEIKKNQ